MKRFRADEPEDREEAEIRKGFYLLEKKGSNESDIIL